MRSILRGSLPAGQASPYISRLATLLTFPPSLLARQLCPDCGVICIPADRATEPQFIILGFGNERFMALLAVARCAAAWIAEFLTSKSRKRLPAFLAFLSHIPYRYRIRSDSATEK